MTRKHLVEQIFSKKSFLCIGLDVDLNKIPSFLLDFEDPIFEFNKRIIDATHDLCVAYKPNAAFYEAHGSKGWVSMEKTFAYISDNIFKIADAKRGDIGNTSKMYAKAFLQDMNADSITISPYMGSDSVKPFLEFENKWGIILGVTSNAGAMDVQMIKTESNVFVFEEVLKRTQEWGTDENMMYVIGGTRPEIFEKVREIIPNHFLLIPGVGEQGGKLNDFLEAAWNKDCGMLVNSSRGIIYASNGTDFAEKAREKALEIQQEMQKFIEDKI